MNTNIETDLATDIQSNLEMILAENQLLASKLNFEQIAELIPFYKTQNAFF